MAASHPINSLTLTAAALCCLLLIPSAAAAATDLATQVCRKTTDFNFCRAAVYSDSRAPGADRYVLIDIVFRLAYRTASGNRDYIAREARSGGGDLKKCLADYEKAINIVQQVLNDLNSESYYDLASRSLEIQSTVADCRRGPPPLAERNQNMLKIANICYVVSNLF